MKRRAVFQKLGVKEIERQQAIQRRKFERMLAENTTVKLDEPVVEGEVKETDTDTEIVSK